LQKNLVDLGAVSFHNAHLHCIAHICFPGSKHTFGTSQEKVTENCLFGKGVAMFSHLTFGTFMLLGIFEQCALGALDISGFD
jgi:hypothetical protein